jgi:hypothetical protein
MIVIVCRLCLNNCHSSGDLHGCNHQPFFSAQCLAFRVDGHRTASSLRPTPSVSALLPTTMTTTTTTRSHTKRTTAGQDEVGDDSDLVQTSRRPSRHGNERAHTVCDSRYDRMNALCAFPQAPIGHDRLGQTDRHGPMSLELSPTHTVKTNHHDQHASDDGLLLPLHSQPPPPPPHQHRPKVLVKRTRSNASHPSGDSRPNMLASHSSSASSATHTTASSHASSGFWRSSVGSSPNTSPGTSEAHSPPSSNSPCPPARPHTYFAELQPQTVTTNTTSAKARAMSSAHFNSSFFDTRYPRVAHGNGSQDSSSTATFKSRAQNYILTPASVTLPPPRIAPSLSSSSSTGRKLTKKRPQSQAQALPAYRYSASASTPGLGRNGVELPASPAAIEARASRRGRSAARGEGRDEKLRSRSRSRSLVCAKVRGSMDESKEKKARGTVSESGHGNEKVDYLPPVRVLEPLWVGNGAVRVVFLSVVEWLIFISP